jgi:hypothetical protein
MQNCIISKITHARRNIAFSQEMLLRTGDGRDMGDPAEFIPEPLSEPYGFQDPLIGCDFEYSGHPDKYKRDEHPAEYARASPRGRPDWQRYPWKLKRAFGISAIWWSSTAYSSEMPTKAYESNPIETSTFCTATRHVSPDAVL